MSFIGNILTRNGSDKDMPGHHNYGPIYDKLFLNDRDQVRLVMEIGIVQGASVLSWLEIFPRATVVGIDIEPYHGPCPPRLEVYQGDQRDELALLRAAKGRKFDIIIEDASHFLDSSLRTLFFLWPYVARGGYYIIEELEGVNSHLESLSLFSGIQLHRADGPQGGDEYLVVLKK